MKQKLIENIQNTLKEKGHCVVAIDGRCAAGKSTLASELAEEFDGQVIHMDDFFLRPEQRTKERFETPGENVDHERMMEEVFPYINKEENFSYYPFDCSIMEIASEPIEVKETKLIIVEGSYSLRKEFRPYYDITVFLTISPSEQIERIANRNPDKLDRFINEWIPLEEKYFEAYEVEKAADYIIE